MTVSHGQTFNSPPAKPGDYLVYLILFGSCVFLAIVGQQKAVFETSWASRLEKRFPWLAGVVLLGLIAILATTTGEATGKIVNTWNPAAWFEVVQQTRVGHLWAARALLAVVLFGVILYVRRLSRVRWHYILWAVAASLPVIAGSLMSHSGAEEISFVSIASYALHILLAGVWFGALPAFLLTVYDSHRSSDKTSSLLNAASLKEFLATALPVMLLMIATGLMVADRMVETYYHALVASSYGWLLNFKLALLGSVVTRYLPKERCI